MKLKISAVFFDLVYLICGESICLKTYDNSVVWGRDPISRCLKTYDNSDVWDWDPMMNSYLLIRKEKWRNVRCVGLWNSTTIQ